MSSSARLESSLSWGPPADSAAWLPTATSRYRRDVLILIVIAFCARLIFAGSLGLGVDESYTAATARHFQLSYFDHPPAAWWLVGLVERLGGDHNAFILRLPFVLLFALSMWLMFELTTALFDERAGLWATIAFSLSPVFAATSGSWVLPDGPLLAAMLASALFLARALFVEGNHRRRSWVLAGLFAGLALLSKYHGIFLFSGIGLFLITQQRYRFWLQKAEPYAGASLAFCFFLPVLVWNAQHHWASFVFQSGRGEFSHFDLAGPLIVLGGQALYLGPWLWPPLMAAAIAAVWRGSGRAKAWFLLCLGCGPIVIFSLVAFWAKETLWHWAAPGYLFCLPLLGAEIAARLPERAASIRLWAGASALFLVGIATLAVTELQFGWLERVSSSFSRINPWVEAVDWNDLRVAVNARRATEDRSLGFIATTKWVDAGKADYALGDEFPVLCLCAEPHEYALLNRAGTHVGQDALVLGQHLTLTQVDARYGRAFERIDQGSPILIRKNGRIVVTLQSFYARGFRPSALLTDPVLAVPSID